LNLISITLGPFLKIINVDKLIFICFFDIK
jgi:hypothetical protein